MDSDAVLVDRVVAGADGAFDELYRRHATAAWQLGHAVTGNAHDAADAVSEAFARVLQAVRQGRLENGSAFRSYLLTATRHAGLDTLRRRGRTHPADAATFDTVEATGATPPERIADAEDAGLVVEAFRGLPERWRSVLWLTEVEGVATKDAADHLGLSANGTAQLAVRARAGLRDRYLQAHLKGDARPGCRFTVDHLGAYVGGGIAPRDLAKVDQHLAGCDECRARKADLDDLGRTLRRIALPVPLALGASSAERVHAVLTASTAPITGLAGRAVHLVKEPTPFMKKAVGASAAGVLALGLLALPFVADQGDAPVRGLSSPSTAVTPASAELPDAITGSAVLPETFSTGGTTYALPSSSDGFSSPRTAFAAPAAPAAPGSASSPVADRGVPAAPPAATAPDPSPLAPLCGVLSIVCAGGGGTGGGSTLPEPAPVPPVDANVGVNLGGHVLGTSADVSTSPTVGAVVDETQIGSPAPTTPDTQGVTIQIGPISQTIPLALP